MLYGSPTYAAGTDVDDTVSAEAAAMETDICSCAVWGVGVVASATSSEKDSVPESVGVPVRYPL